MTLPWSLKFIFGMVNDCFPICGYRRKPYMIMGWAFCACALTILAYTELPPPYWCRDELGVYITKHVSQRGSNSYGRPMSRPCLLLDALQHV